MKTNFLINNSSKYAFKYQKGVSLIELMVGIAVGLVILGAGTKLIFDASYVHKTKSEIQKMRNDASFAFSDMKRSAASTGIPTFCPNKSLTMANKADYSAKGDNGQLFDYINPDNNSYALSKSSNLLAAFDTMPGVMAYEYRSGGSFEPAIPSQIMNLFNPKPVSDVLILGFYDFNPSFSFESQTEKKIDFKNNLAPLGVVGPGGSKVLPNGIIDNAPHSLSTASGDLYNPMRFDDCSTVSARDKTYIFLAKASANSDVVSFDVASSYSGKPWNSQEAGPVSWDATYDPVAVARKYQFAYIKKVVYYVGLDANGVRTLYRGDIFNYLPSTMSQVIRTQAIARNVDRFELLFNVAKDDVGTLNWLPANNGQFYITRTNGVKASLTLSSPFIRGDGVKPYTIFAGTSNAENITPSDTNLRQTYEITWALNNRL